MALSVKNISVSFPGVKALQDVSIEFQPKRIHAVLGANGSGKSTLVKVLTGNYHPDKDLRRQNYHRRHRNPQHCEPERRARFGNPSGSSGKPSDQHLLRSGMYLPVQGLFHEGIEDQLEIGKRLCSGTVPDF